MPTSKIWLPVLLLFWLAAPILAKDVVVIADKNVARSQKEALLILPGFGSKLHGSKHQKKYFAGQGYDLFIPDYISRKSLERTQESLDEFIRKHHLQEYRKVHVFSYIVGGWTINTWIAEHPDHNIATIVYDRSPLQERAPYALVRDQPFLMKILVGPILKDFSQTPYPALNKKEIRIGIIVETKATKMIRRHKKTALSMGPVTWDMGQFQQAHDDALYTWLNHDDMYKRFDVIGQEVLHFMRQGRFTDQARRLAPEGDPFVAYREE